MKKSEKNFFLFVYSSSKKVSKLRNDMYKVEARIGNQTEIIGQYACLYNETESINNVYLSTQNEMQPWSKWSSWSKWETVF